MGDSARRAPLNRAHARVVDDDNHRHRGAGRATRVGDDDDEQVALYRRVRLGSDEADAVQARAFALVQELLELLAE